MYLERIKHRKPRVCLKMSWSSNVILRRTQVLLCRILRYSTRGWVKYIDFFLYIYNALKLIKFKHFPVTPSAQIERGPISGALNSVDRTLKSLCLLIIMSHRGTLVMVGSWGRGDGRMWIDG